MANSVSTLVIAGLSGAGKSAATHLLEDLGFFCVDSILPHLTIPLLTELRSHYPQVVIGLELSREEFLKDFAWMQKELAAQEIPLLFLDSADPVLVRRFSAHRRRHPLIDQAEGLLAAIQLERQMLQPVRAASQVILDTSDLSLRQLQYHLEQVVLKTEQPPLTVSLMSFGFKHGVPLDANLVFDVRFLPNPYYIPELRPLTGQDPAIQDFLFGDPLTQSTYQRIHDLVQDFLPHYRAERRTQVIIAIGCTGGQHRSVATIERLAKDLQEEVKLTEAPYTIQVFHRHVATSKAEQEGEPERGTGNTPHA